MSAILIQLADEQDNSCISCNIPLEQPKLGIPELQYVQHLAARDR